MHRAGLVLKAAATAEQPAAGTFSNQRIHHQETAAVQSAPANSTTHTQCLLLHAHNAHIYYSQHRTSKTAKMTKGTAC